VPFTAPRQVAPPVFQTARPETFTPGRLCGATLLQSATPVQHQPTSRYNALRLAALEGMASAATSDAAAARGRKRALFFLADSW
jgi:hypothetical protein